MNYGDWLTMDVGQAKLKLGTDSFSMIDFVRHYRDHEAMRTGAMRNLEYEIDDDTQYVFVVKQLQAAGRRIIQ